MKAADLLVMSKDELKNVPWHDIINFISYDPPHHLSIESWNAERARKGRMIAKFDEHVAFLNEEMLRDDLQKLQKQVKEHVFTSFKGDSEAYVAEMNAGYESGQRQMAETVKRLSNEHPQVIMNAWQALTSDTKDDKKMQWVHSKLAVLTLSIFDCDIAT